MSGTLTPYLYLFTTMKSPTSNVGIIDPEGIRNGSIINDLMKSTINSMGNNEARNSVVYEARLLNLYNFCKMNDTPQIKVNIKRRAVKSILFFRCHKFIESLFRNIYIPNFFHLFFAFFLFLK